MVSIAGMSPAGQQGGVFRPFLSPPRRCGNRGGEVALRFGYSSVVQIHIRSTN